MQKFAGTLCCYI